MLWFICFLALALRLPLIGQSLWLDESIEAIALQGHYGNLWSYSLSDFQPPLYHYINLLWTHIFGFSEISLRSISLFAGILCVAFIYKIANLLGSKKTAVVAGLLAATNPLLIYYSQEGRTYMLTAFFAAASFYYLLRTTRNKKENILIPILYFLFTIGLLWTSYLSWFLVAFQGIYLLVKKKYKLFGLTFLAGLTLILWLPSLVQSLTLGLDDATQLPGWGKVVGGISLKAVALTWVKWNIGRISFDSSLLYGGIVVLLFSFHAFILTKLRSLNKVNPHLYIWILTLILCAIVSFFVPAYSYTRVLFILPAYLIFLSLGLTKIKPIYSILLLMLNIVFISIYWINPSFHREDWRSLVSYINQQSNVSVAIPSLDQDPPLIYYKLKPELKPSTEAFSTNKVAYIKYVEEIYDPSRVGPQSLISNGYQLTEQHVFPGLQVDVYTVK